MNTFLTFSVLLMPIFLYLTRKKSSKQLPPGSLGLPIIGQSLTILRAMQANTAEKWLEERIRKYGPVSKMSLFGRPTVFIHGPAANKFLFTSYGSTISSQQAKCIRRIMGDWNLVELRSEDHTRVRAAIVSFLKPESLKRYVGKIDVEIIKHLEADWQGKEKVKVLPSMKKLAFNIIYSLLLGLNQGRRRDEFLDNFEEVVQGVWSVPIGLPFTRYSRSLRASARVQNMITELVNEKRVELNQNGASTHQDLITCLLNTRSEHNEELLTEKEIVI